MRFLATIALCALSTPVFAQIVVNEVCPANVKSAVDDFDQSSDWIELYNSGASSANLAGYMLSDNPLEQDKFVFGDVDIAAGGYLVVWASGRDIGNDLNWDTIVDYGAQVHYYDATAAPAGDWREPGYDASSWQLGASPLGQGYSHIATSIASQRVALRIEFSLTAREISDLEQLRFHIDYDDGFAAHINGIEVARDNLGIYGVNPQWLSDAPSQHTGSLQWGGAPDDFRVDNPTQLLVEGVNVLTVEVHSIGNDGTLSLTPFLSIGKKHSAPPGAPSAYIDFEEDNDLHTSFSLKASGEDTLLSDASGTVVSALTSTKLWADQTCGYDAANNVVIFHEATPGEANSAMGMADVVEQVAISPDGAASNSASQTVTLSCPTAGADIWYTLDSSEPQENGAASNLYVTPFTVSPGVNPVVGVRATAFVSGWWPSRVKTASFLFGLQHDMKIWSIVTDPYYMWDP
ncbi:MAG: lamin tail domain-containing protein, partial [Planctomycetota bacterium]|nr:lamin tail domain-containing protein [Planctomycetota bacterium]